MVSEKFQFAWASDGLITRKIAGIDEETDTVLNRIREADAGVVNLEILIYDYDSYPASNDIARFSGTYLQAPSWVLDELSDLGFSLFSAASNHTGDFSHGRMVQTMQELERRSPPGPSPNSILTGTSSSRPTRRVSSASFPQSYAAITDCMSNDCRSSTARRFVRRDGVGSVPTRRSKRTTPSRWSTGQPRPPERRSGCGTQAASGSTESNQRIDGSRVVSSVDGLGLLRYVEDARMFSSSEGRDGSIGRCERPGEIHNE